MQLTETEQAIFRFVKKPGDKNWRDLVAEYLGDLYHYDMKLIDVHRIVYKLYVKMIAEPRFEVGVEGMYQILLTQVTDWDFLYNRKNAFTPEEIIEGQLEKMLMGIRLSRIDWIKHQYM